MITGVLHKFGLNARRSFGSLVDDRDGVAAVEFALLLPLFLLLFFGTIQVSTAVAVDRKVTILTRTISDLISQASSIQDQDITNAFNMANPIFTPYNSSTVTQRISQIYIDTTLVAKVKWSKGSNIAAYACNTVISVPTGLAVAGRYLIMSEVTYNYQPVVGFDSKLSFVSPTFPLSDQTFTRPRQSNSVLYSSAPTCT